MIKLKINGKRYKIFNNWREITAAKAIEADNVPVPKKLKSLIFASESDRENIIGSITEDEHFELLKYYRGILLAFSAIPESEVIRLSDAIIEVLFTENHYGLVYEMKTFQPNIEPTVLTWFGFHRFKHLTLGENLIAHYKISIGEFAEASDLIEGIDGLVLSMASYLATGEKKILKKADALKRKSMLTIWRLFFYMLRF